MDNSGKEENSQLSKSVSNANSQQESLLLSTEENLHSRPKIRSPQMQRPNILQPSGIFSTAEDKAQWKRLLASAKFAWNKLTESELLRTEGNEQKLTGLVEGRYSVTREEANKQVKHFLEKFQRNG